MTWESYAAEKKSDIQLLKSYKKDDFFRIVVQIIKIERV